MDKRYLLAFGMGAGSLALGILVVRLLGLGSGVPLVPREQVEPPVRLQNLSGPYTHKNLTVYLVHGDDVLRGRTPLTLEEAMDRKLVRVHETSEVNELEIENISASDEVYVQAGDIVKGGRQDRVLAVDLIVPARSGRMPISSFCVEHGRWTARGDESAAEFNSADNMLASKDLKLAAKHSNSQSEVWDKVGEVQRALSTASNTSVASNASRSSLPLSLENDVVRANADDYIRALRDIIDNHDDVIGFVFAINGETNSADTYGSHALFEKMWPRLLKASAIEAVAAAHRAKTSDDVSLASIRDFLDNGETARISNERSVTDRVRMLTREFGGVVFIESRDSDRGSWLHRNYILR